MSLWRLSPIDLKDPNWLASSHRGRVLVRAPTEAAARSAAEQAFGVKTRFPPGGGVTTPPWTRATLVRAERVQDERYDPEGPTEVLDPSL